MIFRHASPGMACRDSCRKGGRLAGGVARRPWSTASARDIVDLLWLEPKSARLQHATRGLLVCNVVEREGAISVTHVTTLRWANGTARSAQAARNSRLGVGVFGPRRLEAFLLACKGRGSVAALANRGEPLPKIDFVRRRNYIRIPRCTSNKSNWKDRLES